MTDTANSFTDDVTVDFTAQVVSSVYAGLGDRVQPSDVAATIKAVGSAFRELQIGGGSVQFVAADADVEKPTKAQIKKSVTPDGIISFLDGKSYKSMKRHLTRHGLDEHSYRERYGLPIDYPLVAPNYSAARSEMARKLGLGSRGKAVA